MDTDLLPPEEDQQTRADDGLEEAYSKPAIEDFRRNAGQDRVAQAQKAAGFVTKNKKWFVGGGVSFAIIIPIAAFFMWMMLFKNVHIKNLYVTYRWAQFNRGLHKALKAQLDYTKANPADAPSGKADTVVRPTDAPDDITRNTNAAEFDAEKIDPNNPADIDAESKRISSLEQSVEGTTQKALDDAGASRAVKPTEGDTPEEKTKSAKSNLEEDLSKNRSLEGDVPDTLKEGVDKAKAEEAAGKSAKEAAEAGADAVKTGSGFLKVARTLGTVTEVATFACLFRDIYLNAKEQINKIAIGGAVAVSQETNKTADCQKLGECSTEQISAVAEKYDNDEQSFTESCGYTRATQSSNPTCNEIDPQFVVNGVAKEIGGLSGGALTTVDAILDPPISFFNTGADTTCKVVTSPFFQGADTILSLGLTVASGGGWGAAKTAVVKGGLVFAGTAGGKALIASAIMKYSGSLYKDLRPWDMGNLNDMGNLVTASASCQTGYCPQATNAELAQLDREYRAERIATNSKKSILEKFFDTDSPDSVTSRVVLNAPVTPTAVVGRIKNVFATISNPIKLNITLGKNSLAITKSQTAYAADDGASSYGLEGKVTVPPNLLPGSSSYSDVIAWGKNRDLSTLESEYKNCGGDQAETYSKSVGSNDTKCLWSSMDSTGKMFMQYKYAQNVAYKVAISHNDQTSLSTSAPATSGATSDTSGIDRDADTVGLPCPTGTTSAGSARTFRGSTIGLCDIGDGTIVNTSAAKAFYDMKQAAAADGITLYGGGFRSYTEQVALRKQNCPDWQNSRASACSPPTAKPGTSMHEVGLAIDMRNSSTRGTAVHQWLAANAARFGIENYAPEPWHWSVNGS